MGGSRMRGLGWGSKGWTREGVPPPLRERYEMEILNTNISHGSVATRLRRGGMFNNDIIANLLMSLPVKEL